MSLKHLLNKLIDGAVHGQKPPKSLDQIIVDECLHTIVEGKFQPKKFVRYTLLPLLSEKPHKRRKGRRGARR